MALLNINGYVPGAPSAQRPIINPNFDFGTFAGDSLSDLGAGLVGGQNIQEALKIASDRATQLSPYRAQTAQAKIDKAKADKQESAARKMFAEDPVALKLFDAGDAPGAFNTFMANKYPKAGDPFTLSQGEVRYGPDGQVIARGADKPAEGAKPPEGYAYGPDGSMSMVPGGPAAQKAMQDKFNNEQILNQQYSATDPLKTYQTVNSGYQKVRQSSGLKTGAGDVSMIFAYMKMLDPSSVVREGEFATAQQTAGLPATVVNLYNQAISGVRLNDQQRKDFLGAADEIYKSTSGNLAKQNKLYTSRAAEQGVDPNMFLVDPQTYDPLDQAPAPAEYKQRYGLE